MYEEKFTHLLTTRDKKRHVKCAINLDILLVIAVREVDASYENHRSFWHRYVKKTTTRNKQPQSLLFHCLKIVTLKVIRKVTRIGVMRNHEKESQTKHNKTRKEAIPGLLGRTRKDKERQQKA